MKRTVIARAQVVIEVDCGTWDDGVNVAELVKRSRAEAREKIACLLNRRNDVRIVSVRDGSVTAIDSEDKP